MKPFVPKYLMEFILLSNAWLFTFFKYAFSIDFEQTCEPFLGSDPSVEIHSHAIQIENDYDHMCSNMIISNDQSKMWTWHIIPVYMIILTLSKMLG